MSDRDSEIAERLNISINTVRDHIRSIYDKLHVHSKSAAVGKALRNRLISQAIGGQASRSALPLSVSSSAYQTPCVRCGQKLAQPPPLKIFPLMLASSCFFSALIGGATKHQR
jgi:hypothetical protein